MEIPPAEELDQARHRISERLATFNPERDKIETSYPPEAAVQHREDVLDQITIQLRAHKRPEVSEVNIYNYVTIACGSVEVETRSTKPAVVNEVTRELVAAARKLHRVLGRSDLPPYYSLRVFGTMQNWNEFIGRLERLTALTYTRPVRNIDRVKHGCANYAHLLITVCTTEVPTGTAGGLFRIITNLLYQFAYPTKDEIVDLKTACDKVLKRIKAGQDLEILRW